MTLTAHYEAVRAEQRAAEDPRLIPPRGFHGMAVSLVRRQCPAGQDMADDDRLHPGRVRRDARLFLRKCGMAHLVELVEALLSELVTNALRYGIGDVGVQLSLSDGHLHVAVDDGSPNLPTMRESDDDSVSGRGLLLVDTLLAEHGGRWGVSNDGTRTWCTLRTRNGGAGGCDAVTSKGVTPEDLVLSPSDRRNTDMEPAARTAPVLVEMPLTLPADATAMTMARLQGRTLLTALGWPGDVPTAVDVLHVLVDNAVHHGLAPDKEGQSLGASLRVTEAHELLVEVSDPDPKFPNFDAAFNGDLKKSLWHAKRPGTDFAWYVTPGFRGKTVRATMRPGPVDL